MTSGNKATDPPKMMKIIKNTAKLGARYCTSNVVGSTAKNREFSGRDNICINHASFIVDGKPRCNLHAKVEALNYILEQN